MYGFGGVVSYRSDIEDIAEFRRDLECKPIKIRVGGRFYTIVYDGTLFNGCEIRSSLCGCDFETKSDAETVVKAYAKWGGDCVNRLNGTFSFAIWDESERQLFIARDRIGGKPLFYWQGEKKFVFASRLEDLFADPEVTGEADSQSVLQLILLAPGRIPGSGVLKNIYEVKPGHCGFYRICGLNMLEYWKLEARDLGLSFNDTAKKTEELLSDSITRQIATDGNICTMLSGGLDSSLISAKTSGVLKNRGKSLRTFSVDYQDNAKYFRKSRFQPDSDPEYIECMREYLGCEHEWIVLDTEGLVSALEDACDARGLPGMADIDASLLLFCKEIQKFAPVVLSGECADELFGGYPWYRDKTIRDAEGFPWSRSTEYRSSFLRNEHLCGINPMEYVHSFYSDTISKADILNGDSQVNNRMRQMTRLNFDWFMQTLVDRSERMGAYCGLEIRVPFCDYRIAEFAYNIPWEYKDYNGREKGLLREALKSWLPEKVVQRKKSPYPKTHNPAFLTAVTEKLEDIIYSGNCRLTEIVKKEELEKLIRHEDSVQWYGQLMNLPQTIAYFIQLEHWLKRHKISIV